MGVIRSLGTKGTYDQPVRCPCEINLWLFCLKHTSCHPSVTGPMVLGWYSHHFEMGCLAGKHHWKSTSNMHYGMQTLCGMMSRLWGHRTHT